MSTKHTFSEVMFLQSQIIPRQAWRLHSKERMYIVDSVASSHTMRLSSVNKKEKKTIRRSVTDAQAKVYSKDFGAYLWIHLVKDSPSVLTLGRLCNELGYSYSWRTGETPRLSEGKKEIECNIENFVPVVAVTKKKAVPPIQFWTATETLSDNKMWRTPFLICCNHSQKDWKERHASSSTPTARCGPTHEVVETQSHDKKLPSDATDAVGDTLAKETKSKKDIIGSQPRGNHNVVTHYPKDPRVGYNLKKRVDGIALFTKFGDLVTADHENSETWKTS